MPTDDRLEASSTIARGIAAGSPAERAVFGLTASFSGSLCVARAVTYVMQRRRPNPRFRSMVRRVRRAGPSTGPRVHHFVPGTGLVLLTGAAAIVSREDGRELVLSIPFGTGAALILDEIGHLVERDNPYWGHERLVLAQAASSAAVAAGLCVRFIALARETSATISTSAAPGSSGKPGVRSRPRAGRKVRKRAGNE